eukprot:COSAG01_NODE_3898_length_5568_cov_2.935272_4_plen_94_part_00
MAAAAAAPAGGSSSAQPTPAAMRPPRLPACPCWPRDPLADTRPAGDEGPCPGPSHRREVRAQWRPPWGARSGRHGGCARRGGVGVLGRGVGVA